MQTFKFTVNGKEYVIEAATYKEARAILTEQLNAAQ
jgi:hypothetical protein